MKIKVFYYTHKHIYYNMTNEPVFLAEKDYQYLCLHELYVEEYPIDYLRILY